MQRFLFGTSKSMRDAHMLADSVGPSSIPILIDGESGVGKQALAEYIHRVSRRVGAFVTSYCGLTGRNGLPFDEEGDLLRQAARGSLFLKHVNLLNRTAQEHLRYALRWETSSASAYDVRVISSATEPLEAAVAAKAFSADLYFQLAGARITIPPLRERLDDVPDFFEACVAATLDHVIAAPDAVAPFVTADLRDAIRAYDWPGNFTELEQLARAHALSRDSKRIIAEIRHRAKTLRTAPLLTVKASLKDQVREAAKELESAIILRTLESHKWNRRRTASTLKISYRALLYKMKDLNMRADVSEGREQ